MAIGSMLRPRRLPQKSFPPYAYLPGKKPHPVRDPTGHRRQLQNYSDVLTYRGNIFRPRPAHFKRYTAKYYALPLADDKILFGSILLIRNNRHDHRSSRRHESPLEPYPGHSVSLAS